MTRQERAQVVQQLLQLLLTDDEQPAPKPAEYLDTQQVAELLGLSTRTLWRWRCRGTGPAWSRCGERAVRYRRADVDAWMAAQTLADSRTCRIV